MNDNISCHSSFGCHITAGDVAPGMGGGACGTCCHITNSDMAPVFRMRESNGRGMQMYQGEKTMNN